MTRNDIAASDLADHGFEWPTWLVIITIYAGWFALIQNYHALPVWFSHAGLIVVTAWFMSLQHEVLHGHPTSNKKFNELFVLFPICPWFPYRIYHDTHMAHHRDELLTSPGIDPESNYVSKSDYDQLSRPERTFRWTLRTVVGRSLLGTFEAVFSVWKLLITGPLKGDFTYTFTWFLHLSLLAILLWWIDLQAGISPLHWLVFIAYPALILGMFRSFYEHRPTALPAHRIAINDAAWPWRLLYLNNNFHSVHHDYPSLPWYKIPAVFKKDRQGYLMRNGNFMVPGYLYLLWHFGFKPVDSPLHPGFDGQGKSPKV